MKQPNMTPDPTDHNYALDADGKLHRRTLLDWRGQIIDVGYLPMPVERA